MSATPEAVDAPSIGERIATIRARLALLGAAHARGEIDSNDYRSKLHEAEHELSEAVLGAPIEAVAAAAGRPLSAATETAAARPSRRLVAALVAIVAVIAIAGYAVTGSPQAGRNIAIVPPASQAPASAETDKQREVGLEQIAAMVDKLAARMKEKPDDAEGWTMLARSYTVLRRFKEAVPAYRRAVALQPKNAGLLADYADALAAGDEGRFGKDSIALIDQALLIDPQQPKALALSGTIAFDRGDYASAVTQWQKIADQLPADSEFHQQVQANIDEARRRGGLAAAPPSRSAPPPSTMAAAGSVSGTVTLAPALASKVAPTDSVFVFARSAEGGRMPLAVFRATVADLPIKFKLDDSMAMAPTMKLSGAKQVIVGARVSKSGNAIPQPGDLAGETGAIATGSTGLAIVIANEVGGK